MKTSCIALGLLLAVVGFAKGEDKIIAYPTSEKPSFLISVPESWEMEQAEMEGDFFHLTGPNGAVFAFRTIEGTEEALEEAIEHSIREVAKRFDALDLGDPADWKPDGLVGFYAVGDAKDREDGTPLRIGMGWCALNDGKIVELWFVAEKTDEEGMNEASAIANSLKAP